MDQKKNNYCKKKNKDQIYIIIINNVTYFIIQILTFLNEEI